jgi:uncharacterized membrane protein (DUF106 family)
MAATIWIIGVIFFISSLGSIFITYYHFSRQSKILDDYQEEIEDINEVMKDNKLKLIDETSDSIMQISFDLKRLNLRILFIGILLVETLGVLIGSVIIYLFKDSWVAHQLFF